MFNDNKPTPLLPAGRWNRTYVIGKVLGLRITAETSAFVAGFVLWAILAVIGKEFLALTGPDVVLGGGLLVLLHYGSEFVHQFGHALAAAQTKYEMTGIHYWLLLSRSIYPPDEPRLPAKLHIKRAMGGPIASGVLSGILGVLTLLLIPVGELLYVSPSSLNMLGYRPEEMVGRSSLEFVNPDDLSELVFRMTHATDGTAPPDSAIFRFQHKLGHTIWLEATGQVVTHTTGELREFIASLRDISARKQAEEAIKQALEKEKELGELKSRFVSMTSHEFRTPLANILATTDTLSTYRQKMTDQQIEQRFNNIRGQVDHLKDIIEDVLQFTRIDIQHVEYHPQPVDLDALCKDIIGEFDIRSDVPHQFIYEAHDVPTAMNLDKKLMRQIINNLVSNAVKYSPADKPVHLRLVCKDQMCTMTVADEGIGIPEADLKHMFVPFHRAGNVGTISGTGLGMIISRKAVELHGGTIAIQSKVGNGTTITVEIPVVTQKE